MRSGAAQTANSVLRFTLELTALTVLGAWGWHTGSHLLQRLALATLAPLLAATGWAQFVAPRAPRYLSRPGRLLVEAAVFGAAVLALVDLGRAHLAEGFTLLAVVNTALTHRWGQDVHARREATSRSTAPAGR